MVLVAFSRVVNRTMLRLAPCNMRDLRQELQGLEHSEDVLAWDRNYDAEGRWKRETFRQQNESERARTHHELLKLTEQDLNKLHVPQLRLWYKKAYQITASSVLRKAQLIEALLVKQREWLLLVPAASASATHSSSSS